MSISQFLKMREGEKCLSCIKLYFYCLKPWSLQTVTVNITFLRNFPLLQGYTGRGETRPEHKSLKSIFLCWIRTPFYSPSRRPSISNITWLTFENAMFVPFLCLECSPERSSRGGALTAAKQQTYIADESRSFWRKDRRASPHRDARSVGT